MAIEKLSENDTELVDFDYFVDNKVSVPAGNSLAPSTETTKRKKRVNPIVKKDENSDVIDAPNTLNSYADNMNELKKTAMQLDDLANELKADLDQVRASRTLKGKYQYTTMLGGNLATILNTKAQVIREMNNTIKNSIELDYKIQKDRMAAQEGNDDKRLMDMYNAFISTPMSTNKTQLLALPTEQQLTLPMSNNVTMVGRNIIRPDSVTTGDPGYDNYINNMTPEQHLMMYENNPDVKQVVVYNEETGERFFDVRNMKTGESIPNVSKHDNMFLEDTIIDKKRGIARNVNLGESYPLVVVGGNSKNTKGF